MKKFKRILLSKRRTIILFFDLEFYVPKNERLNRDGFLANPYNNENIIIGGTFIRNFPLNSETEDETLKFWIWNYNFDEKLMLTEILQFIKESWSIVNSIPDHYPLMACGIGISRIDISYLFGRISHYNIEEKSKLFEILNLMRLIELENLTVPFFRSYNDLIITKNTSQINDKFKINRKREPSKKIWDYYDEKNFVAIEKRNTEEVLDQVLVYKNISKYLLIQNLPKSLSKEKIENIQKKSIKKDDLELLMKYYIPGFDSNIFEIKDNIEDETKYNLMKILIKTSSLKNKKYKKKNVA
ncbi:hypothetical protein ND860_18800 [Leptospira levettii]|uniref:hypothetical protein n=1 Tax=Leptospira levettii TaxID=2023178 RepID=UPI00223D1866|nr:hypothetical protein [Leptospira levettii]MCW7498591.1 hypothetical protein [Leptospira levettii]